MSEGIKKSSYHFEFVNPRQMKKYKFYFFDYLYYMGEITILFEYIENSEAKRAIIYGWGMFPIVFCLLRYRKARCDALMKHYDGKKHIGIIKLLFTPLALFVLEQWLFGKLGWTDSIW